MRKRLPSTMALQAFEAAARHESFTHAAQELSLTQGAVCRQIASLEAFVGVPLFNRVRRGVRLTDAGERYGRLVRRQLDAIERDTLAIMAHQGGGVVDLAVVPTFATRWLLPRLAHPDTRCPGLQVNMATRTRPFLFDETEFDAAIYSGDPGWPGTQAHFLMQENPVPVCSPSLAAGPLDAADIAALPLLQQSTRPTAWRDWFASTGVPAPGDMAGTRLELFSMLSQAASDGLGVALIPPFLVQRELDEGRLHVLNPHSGPGQRAFHLIVPERKAAVPALIQFRDWLIGQARSASGT
ncbi:LysR substrate-binding domain-containing protein [Castellaniella sp. MT123]|uniref:LysR substrate-binding domain-containing protein n=1 Tax=Castellaniella sp. MT123 TaxID=3140381 RepID=UPI0031F34798|nr:LysR family transcriptional regulator [Castellaniella sp.]